MVTDLDNAAAGVEITITPRAGGKIRYVEGDHAAAPGCVLNPTPHTLKPAP